MNQSEDARNSHDNDSLSSDSSECVPKLTEEKTRRVRQKDKSAEKLQAQVQRIPPGYKLPTRFGEAVDLKLLNKKEVFNATEVSAILREVAKSVIVYTYRPETDQLIVIIQKMLSKYPHFALKNTPNRDLAEVKYKHIDTYLIRLLGIGTCKKFREKLLELVPFIISAAKKTGQKNVKELLKSPRFSLMASDFGMHLHFISDSL